MTALLPDCMMPDGGDPCAAFIILQEKAESLKAENVRLTLALSFARSVIKCGESWTDECTKIIDGALSKGK